MKCPFCGASDTKVVDTRTMEDNSVIRRSQIHVPAILVQQHFHRQSQN